MNPTKVVIILYSLPQKFGLDQEGVRQNCWCHKYLLKDQGAVVNYWSESNSSEIFSDCPNIQQLTFLESVAAIWQNLLKTKYYLIHLHTNWNRMKSQMPFFLLIFLMVLRFEEITRHLVHMPKWIRPVLEWHFIRIRSCNLNQKCVYLEKGIHFMVTYM